MALEMLRNPYIIFLDEPLSGLSYSDSRRFLSILKEEAYKGKLVFITSPLPAAELFNMFDMVWLIDQDGYLIYSGEPSGTFSHFRNTGLLPYYYIPTGSEQVNPEDVIKIVEMKKIHSDGAVSDERLVSPGAWYDAWRAVSGDGKPGTRTDGKPVPINPSRLPGIEKQFVVYLLRNFRVRFSNRSYILMAILGVPVIGALIAATIRIIYGSHYVFADNEYLPLYIFLALNYVLFSGLLTGAGEIFSDRKRMERDLSLNLSYFSFQNSKVAFLMIVSAIQTFLFALAGNLILGINDMLLPYTVTFFSLAASGNLAALALAAGIRRINSMFILIPFLTIPGLLFSGYLIRYDHSIRRVPDDNIVPIIAEIVPTRWAYEALMVDQYAENPYNRYFFGEEKKLYQNRFVLNQVIPTLEKRLTHCEQLRQKGGQADSLGDCLSLISHEFTLLGEGDEIAPFEKQKLLNATAYDSSLYNEISGYLTYVRFLMENTIPETLEKIDFTRQYLADSLESTSVDEFRIQNQNKSVEDMVTGSHRNDMILDNGVRLVKYGSPVFITPESDYGRARFFASLKRFNDQFIPVFRFNLSMIWMINLLIYLVFLIDGAKYLPGLFRSQTEK